MQVGRMIFYDVKDGTIIKDTGEYPNAARKKTVDEQIATYSELRERTRSSFDVLELEFGQYSKEISENTSFRVNPKTKKLEFSKEDKPGNGEPSIEEQMKSLNKRVTDTEEVLNFMLDL